MLVGATAPGLAGAALPVAPEVLGAQAAVAVVDVPTKFVPVIVPALFIAKPPMSRSPPIVIKTGVKIPPATSKFPAMFTLPRVIIYM